MLSFKNKNNDVQIIVFNQCLRQLKQMQLDLPTHIECVL